MLPLELFDEVELDAMYTQRLAFLAQRATHIFGIPGSDAESLAHGVLMAYLRKSEITDADAWLIGAISSACRRYLQMQPRGSADDEALHLVSPLHIKSTGCT